MMTRLHWEISPRSVGRKSKCPMRLSALAQRVAAAKEGALYREERPWETILRSEVCTAIFISFCIQKNLLIDRLGVELAEEGGISVVKGGSQWSASWAVPCAPRAMGEWGREDWQRQGKRNPRKGWRMSSMRACESG